MLSRASVLFISKHYIEMHGVYLSLHKKGSLDEVLYDCTIQSKASNL